jgi:general stress protein YciG
MENKTQKQPRGFAAMSKEQQREIASKGGRSAHAHGTAHEFTSEEARVAGRKGGLTVANDREHMAAIGRAGGIRAKRHPAGSKEQKEEKAQAAPAVTSDSDRG